MTTLKDLIMHVILQTREGKEVSYIMDEVDVWVKTQPLVFGETGSGDSDGLPWIWHDDMNGDDQYKARLINIDKV